MRNVSNVLQKIKTHILCSITFSRKPCRLWDNVEKYGTARQTTDGNIIRRMRFACWITKTTDTHSEYIILIAFHGKNGYADEPQCYVYSTLPVFSTQRRSHILRRAAGWHESVCRLRGSVGTATELQTGQVEYKDRYLSGKRDPFHRNARPDLGPIRTVTQCVLGEPPRG
jgi:hypothetical protein